MRQVRNIVGSMRSLKSMGTDLGASLRRAVLGSRNREEESLSWKVSILQPCSFE